MHLFFLGHLLVTDARDFSEDLSEKTTCTHVGSIEIVLSIKTRGISADIAD